MKKLIAVAAMAFVLTGFVSPAFADGGEALAERMRIQAEKRYEEYEKEKAAKKANKEMRKEEKKENKSTGSEKKAEQGQNQIERFRVSEHKGGR